MRKQIDTYQVPTNQFTKYGVYHKRDVARMGKMRWLIVLGFSKKCEKGNDEKSYIL